MFPDKSSFSQTNDEELVLKAQEGLSEAEGCLIERFKDTAERTAGVFYSKYLPYCSLGLLDKDDLYQEGLLGLLSAIYSYRQDKGSSFRTYASVCICNRIKLAIRNANSKRNVPFGNLVSIDDTVIAAPDSPEDSFISNETQEAFDGFISRELSGLENSVLRLFLQDMSYKDISENLEISVKSVDNAIQRIRTKFREYLDNDRS